MILCILLTFLMLSSCGPLQPAPKESKSIADYIAQAPIVYSADFYTRESEAYVLDTKDLFSVDVSSGYFFSVQNKPTWLNLSTVTGELSGTPSSNGLFDKIQITATKISDGSTLKTEEFSIAVNGDPLRKHAWHLKNTGQRTFSLRSGTSGIDLNIADVWKNGITGAGIKIAISDSGVEINHDDLYLNTLVNEHRDYTIDAPYIGNPTPSSPHGTAVAGIINATGWNNRGGIGVAPEAKFAAFQFLESFQTGDILISQASGEFDVFNFSYGDTLYSDTLSDPDYIDFLKFQTLNNKKVYVKSAGNEYIQYSSDKSNLCASHNANFPFENESPFVIIVGAVNADGEKATYSSTGSNLWVTAPGGEYGDLDPAMLTTDLPTCFKGYSEQIGPHINSFEFGHALNENCHYTSTMNGTSAAAPTVTGVVALMKQANPNLTQRDIKHIFAQTSTKVDPNFTNIWGNSHPSNRVSGCSTISSPSAYTYEQGWVTNAAGYNFSNFYGFGLVDVQAAVSAAQSYTTYLPTLQELNHDFSDPLFTSSNTNLSINNSVTDKIGIAHALTVESVQLKVKATHSQSGVLGVELTSPLGTKSILMNINNSFLLDDDSNLNIVLTSHAFYGESSVGEWVIKVIDGGSGTSGTLNTWKINILGR